MTTENTPNQEQESNAWGAFGNLFDEAPETPTPAETAAEPQAEQPDPTTPEQPVAPTDAEVPIWTGQEEAGRSFKELRDREKAAELAAQEAAREAAYWRGIAEANARQHLNQQTPAPQEPAAPAEPHPDDFNDVYEYMAAREQWTEQKLARQFEQKFGTNIEQHQQQLYQMRWDNSMLRAETAAKDEWAAIVRYANAMQETSPGFAQDLKNAADPGMFVLEAYQRATGRGFAPAPQNPAEPPAPAQAAAAPLTVEQLLADPALKQKAIELIAAEAASKGDTPPIPQNQGPRGVGGSPGAAGVPDGTISPDQVRNLSKPQLDKLGAQTFAGLFTK